MKTRREMSNSGDTFREVAEKLGIALASVSSYLNKGRQDQTSEGILAKNAHSCSDVFGSGGPNTEQKSDFLNEEEVPVETR